MSHDQANLGFARAVAQGDAGFRSVPERRVTQPAPSTPRRGMERKRRIDLTRDELVALGDWHIREADHLEEHRAHDPEAVARARRHRNRADGLYDKAASLGYRDGR